MDTDRSAVMHEAIEAFYFAYRAFTECPDRILEERGLGRVHHRILYFVGRHPGITVNALLQVLKVSKQALNAPLRQLLALELIAMSAASSDRRFKELTLSAEGRKLEAVLSGTQIAQLSKVFADAGLTAEAGWSQVMRALVQQHGHEQGQVA